MEKCIKSVLIGGEDVEVIIVDDGSTKDDTDSWLAVRSVLPAIKQQNGQDYHHA